MDRDGPAYVRWVCEEESFTNQWTMNPPTHTHTHTHRGGPPKRVAPPWTNRTSHLPRLNLRLVFLYPRWHQKTRHKTHNEPHTHDRGQQHGKIRRTIRGHPTMDTTHRRTLPTPLTEDNCTEKYAGQHGDIPQRTPRTDGLFPHP